jgi:hypothetical protein
MHWILQDNLFHDPKYVELEQTLIRLQLPYSIHKVIPFVGELIPEPTSPINTICCGTQPAATTGVLVCST